MEILNTTRCSQKTWTLVCGSSLRDTYNYEIYAKKGTPLGVPFFISEEMKKLVTSPTIISYDKRKTLPPWKRLSIQLSIISKLLRNLH